MSFIKRNLSRVREIGVLAAPISISRSFWAGKTALVAIFQMGKVGSSSIQASLRRHKDLASFQFHRFGGSQAEILVKSPWRLDNVELGTAQHEIIGLLMRRRMKELDLPLKVITLVREPIGRNLSAYFQNWDHFKRMRGDHKSRGAEGEIKHFLAAYDHQIPEKWLAGQFSDYLDVDVFSHEFDKEAGHGRIRSEHADILLMHHDLEDELKRELISDLVGLQLSPLVRANEAEGKAYAAIYQQVRQPGYLPVSHVEEMLNSRYTRHFYSLEQRQIFAENWCGAEAMVSLAD
ncbi:putative capsular polysaccharide synthesis family protein [Altererythrobacter sp.]|uniref:putative capsular polysaccharide synthesis family protein n=1 Tax=Altererythrobacter sp. TaxID=1872480 RepID=UPI001B1C856D|nr:putative capsular polysaccharide synthesis family protein [Altererythrobacter sp.]MBO6944611.1 hypothetical protein [Altererythrobacter sp.]